MTILFITEISTSPNNLKDSQSTIYLSEEFQDCLDIHPALFPKPWPMILVDEDEFRMELAVEEPLTLLSINFMFGLKRLYQMIMEWCYSIVWTKGIFSTIYLMMLFIYYFIPVMMKIIIVEMSFLNPKHIF